MRDLNSDLTNPGMAQLLDSYALHKPVDRLVRILEVALVSEGVFLAKIGQRDF